MLSKIKLCKQFLLIRHFSYRHFSSVDGKPCASCGGNKFTMKFICENCNALEDPDSNIEKLNYFELLNMYYQH